MAIDLGSAFGKIVIEAQEALGAAEQVGKAFSGIGLAVGASIAAAGVVVAGGVAMLGKSVLSASNDTRTAALEMQSQFGMTAEEAERTAGLARDAWADNWGESIGDVSDVMGSVIQQLGEFGVTSDEEITNATTAALALRDTFEVDTASSIDAARALMDRFGLTGEQAFDMITKGMQSGLSANGDFLESITEYAPVFEAAGFNAEQMYSIMESGAATGVLGTDKIADAIKEMGIKLNEGGDDTKAAFDKIGMSFDDISGFIASGDETWADYFDDIVEGINGIEDPIERQRAQVAIFGTMAEDLGANFTEGLTTAGAALGDFEGATDSLNAKYEDFGSVFEGMKRTVIDAFTPVGDFILGLVNEHMPKIQEVVGQVSEVIGSFFANLEEGMSPLDALIEALWNILPEETLAPLIDFRDNVLPGLMEKFTEVKTAVMEFIGPIAEAAGQFFSWKDVLIVLAGVLGGVVISAIVSVVTAMAPILLVVGAVIAIVALLRNAWENNWGGIQEKVAAVVAFIQNIIQVGFAAIQAFWTEHGAQITATAQAAWAAIQAGIQAVIDIVQKIVGDALAAIKKFWEEHGEAIKETAEKAWNLISDLIDGVFKTIEKLFQAFKLLFEGDWEGFVDKLEEMWETAWNAMVDFLTGLWDLIKPILVTMWTSIKTWFEEKKQDAIDMGSNVVQGIIDGINAVGMNILNALGDWVQAAIDYVKDLLRMESPSRVFHEIGVNIAQGLIDGIEAMAPDVTAAMEGIFSAMGNAAGLAGSFASQFQRQTLDPIQARINELGDRLQTWNEVTERMAADLGYGPGFLTMPGAETELNRLINYEYATEKQKRDARILLQFLDTRNRMQRDYVALQRELAEKEQRLLLIREQQAQNQFLQEQLKLIQLVRESGLGVDILNGITLGIAADAGQLMTIMRDVLSRMIQAAQAELGIASPSKVFRAMGLNLMDSLALGIADGNAVVNSMRQTMADLTAAGRAGAQPSVIDNGQVAHLYGGQHFYIQQARRNVLDDIQVLLAP